MTCAEFEVLLCDYLDGTLDPAGRAVMEEHQRVCSACAEFARDVSGVAAYIQQLPHPEPPPELLAKIAFDIPSGGGRKKWNGWPFGQLFERLLPGLLQPRFAMGMAMTILSFSMLGRFAGIEPRQLKPSDLHPAAVWAAADNRAHRMWERAVKYYENLKLVYEVQTRLQEWTKQEEEERQLPAGDRAVQRSSEGKGSE